MDWDPKERFWWISDEKIRDGAQRRPDDPLYNPGTLYIPPGEYRKLGGFVKYFLYFLYFYIFIFLYFYVFIFLYFIFIFLYFYIFE